MVMAPSDPFARILCGLVCGLLLYGLNLPARPWQATSGYRDSEMTALAAAIKSGNAVVQLLSAAITAKPPHIWWYGLSVAL